MAIQSRIRLKQIRLAAYALVQADRLLLGKVSIGMAVRRIVPAAILKHIFGYNWVYPSLAEAKAAAAGFIPSSHEHPASAEAHLSLAQNARPSDYPALFYLDRIIPTCRSVFDLGGNVGNLFYCYSKYLDLPADLQWTVHDIPEMQELGRKVASRRNELRLRFDGTLERMGEADLLLASGCLHYFDRPLPELLAQSGARPMHVIVNRTPLTDAEPVATVQDAGAYLTACKLYHRNGLIARMKDLGYELIDQWSVPELSVHIPCHPDLSVPTYSGCYFRLAPCHAGREVAVYSAKPKVNRSVPAAIVTYCFPSTPNVIGEA